jgi:hypothetical protein
MTIREAFTNVKTGGRLAALSDLLPNLGVDRGRGKSCW